MIGTKFTMEQCWKTPDGIDVHGTTWRTVDMTGGKDYKGLTEYQDSGYPKEP